MKKEGIFTQMFNSISQKRAEKKLGEAIATYNTKLVGELLIRNPKEFHYILMRDNPDSHNGPKIPDQVFNNPIDLAKHIGFKEVIPLLEQAGFVNKEKVNYNNNLSR